ncbi:putative tyrosinase [Seiridium cardinale]|uniref:Tyrosinase n=1 Tax=Seiridium cardinale TaxID=138064 RepID=A0ABR2XRD5_9PEZI
MDFLAHIHKIYPSTKNYVHGIRRDGKAKNKQFFEEDKDSWDDYIINVVYDRYALNGLSYTIEFDLEGRLVGQVSQRNNGVLSRAQVPLTVPIMVLALYDYLGSLQSMKQEAVRNYQEAHLRWKFVQPGGAVKLASDFPKTRISIYLAWYRNSPGR